MVSAYLAIVLLLVAPLALAYAAFVAVKTGGLPPRFGFSLVKADSPFLFWLTVAMMCGGAIGGFYFCADAMLAVFTR